MSLDLKRKVITVRPQEAIATKQNLNSYGKNKNFIKSHI